jgi:uncharacterized protein YfaS (alpha-2-macroglobulin family)
MMTWQIMGSAAMPVMADEDAVLSEVAVTNNASNKKVSIRGSAPIKEKNVTIADSADTEQKFQNNNVQIRKNFNETAFFFPSLFTDENGNIEFSFTIPEALTEWKLMTLAHSKELASRYDTTQCTTFYEGR